MFRYPSAPRGLLAVAFVLLFLSRAAAQDTLRLSTYNLLNYGNSANNSAAKESNLRTVLQYISPDIAGFNEIFPSGFSGNVCNRLTDTLLGQATAATWLRGAVHNTNNQVQANMLCWRNTTFALIKDSSVCHYLRDIIAYRLYYKAPDLAIYKDTIFLTVIQAHLKAGTAGADAADRAQETQCISNYLSSLGQSGNYILMGDLNLYESAEQAYQNLTVVANQNAKLYDPLNRPGNWNSNISFTDIHTQSPRTATLADGGVNGGLDSRFDFILVSDPIRQGSKGIRYVPGSYRTTGNDGQHFNKSILSTPTNTSVPVPVLQALYNASDHLPVYADFSFVPPHLSTAVAELPADRPLATVVNPFRDRIALRIADDRFDVLSYALIDIRGAVLDRGMLQRHHDWQYLEAGAALAPGLYFLQLSDASGFKAAYRIIKL